MRSHTIRCTTAEPHTHRGLLWFVTAWIALAGFCRAHGAEAATAVDFTDRDAPPHRYKERDLKDRFTLLKADLEEGRIPLDRTSEQAFLLSLLQLLEIPVSSQMWVFSTTSLQLSVISPSNPRALYFNENIYLGFIPGGRIEIISMDPEVGGIFYIFDIPLAGRPLRVERSGRCMNCHSGSETAFLPGLVVKSVVPGPTGGSLESYRVDQSGHAIPYSERFGGWHVTGTHGIERHWGNLIGQLDAGKLSTTTNPPGSKFRADRYPVATSDVLAQVVHEHQVGFATRVIEASYRSRTLEYHNPGQRTLEQEATLENQARQLVRYLLFTDEAAWPAGGMEGDAAFKRDFLRNRRADPAGRSLKDFNLKSRLFEYRCSYMIYSDSFQGLTLDMKSRVSRHLNAALSGRAPELTPTDMSAAERTAIREILQATLPEFTKGW